MTKIIFCLALTLLKLTSAYSLTSSPVDSIGLETKGDKSYILHRVDQKQTLFGILKKYHCTKEEFLEVNPYLKGNAIISYDQILRIPLNPKQKIAKTTEPTTKIIKKEVATVDTKVSSDTTPKKAKQTEKVVIIDPETQKETKIEVSEKVAPKEVVINKNTPLKPLKHKVTLPTETLYGIAHQYKVPASKLREWNKLKSDFVQLGQTLIVEDPANIVGQIVYNPVPKDSTIVVKTPPKKIKKDSALAIKNALKKGKKDTITVAKAIPTKPAVVQGPAADVEKPKVTPKVETKPVVAATPTYVPNAPGVKKTVENGVAEVIDAGEKSDKYLGLHKTAPVGTLVQVRNEANGLSVWVKIIGKLPESGETIIKISPKAFEKLQPRDKRIRAEISYVK